MHNSHIIKKNYEFQKIISKKNLLKNKDFIVYFLKDKDKKFKYGISVGKKIGNAPTRNLIKRQIRNLIYKLIKLEINIGYSIIIIATKNYDKNCYYERERSLFNLIKKLG